MDEMQRAFNVTTSALLETMRIADERDLKQNERIVSIERRVEKMQHSIDSLESLLSELKFQTDILIWTIIFIMTIIIMVEMVRWLTSNFTKSASSSSSKRSSPTKKDNILHTNQLAPVQISLTTSEIEALIEDRVKILRENLRIELDAYKQGLVDAMSNSNRIETLGLLTNSNNSTSNSDMSQPQQRAAAAAAVVSSTLATVVAFAAATAQCTNPQTAEEMT